MAREHARILCSIWRPGDDFRDRSPEAQRLYFLIVSQQQLNNSGVIGLMVNKWARCSAHTDPADIEKALAELEEHRYVVVDRDTEELLVRTFIRNDGVAKQPNVLKSALRLARQIESQTLRTALAKELMKLGHPDAIDTAVEIGGESFRRGSHNPSADPSGNPSGDPSTKGPPNPPATPENNPSANPATDPRSNPSSSPAGWGGGRGRGKGPVPEVVGVGGRASAPEAAPPPAPTVVDPNNPRCRRHAGVAIDDPGPDCRVCRQVRLRVEDDQRAAAAAAPAERATAAAAIEACLVCDEYGYRPEGDYDAVRCDHRTHTAEAS